jgi:hypothetical protein
MIAQELLRLIQQLGFVFQSGALIPPIEFVQYFFPCPLIHHFIHSGQGNSHFWRNVSFLPSFLPLPGNKTFGAIRRLEGATKLLAAIFDARIVFRDSSRFVRG